MTAARRPQSKSWRRRVALAATMLAWVAILLPAAPASAADTVTISGTVTDGSGHGWPLYASITANDIPNPPSVFTTTDPLTGHYSFTVPANLRYAILVKPITPGYKTVVNVVAVGSSDITVDAAASVDQQACSAPGYHTDASGACTKVEGGLVVGQVTDANTHHGINGATVTAGSEQTTTVATSHDLNFDGGVYSLFLAGAGTQKVTASMDKYQSVSSDVTVAPDKVVRSDAALPAGRLAITSGPIEASPTAGGTSTAKVTITNDGSAPATASVAERYPGQPATAGSTTVPLAALKAVTPSAQQHPAVVRLSHPASRRMDIVPKTAPSAGKPVQKPTQKPAAQPAGPLATPGGWTSSLGPLGGVVSGDGIYDNGMARDDAGHVYTVGGATINNTAATPTAKGWVYDPGLGKWTDITPLSTPILQPETTYVNGRLYAAGGWNPKKPGPSTGSMRIYHPTTNKWTTGTDMPSGVAAAGSGVVDGRVYVVGGCSDTVCTTTDKAAVYDPGADAWQFIAPYPKSVAFLGCGGIGGKLYCAGGTDSDGNSTTGGYVYDPKTNAWSKIADMPDDLWGMGYSTAGGKLLLSGGVTDQGTALTRGGYAYDPSSDTWSALPALPSSIAPATYRGAAACGFYRLGGYTTNTFGEPFAADTLDLLSGYDQCGATDIPWLSEDTDHITVPAHGSATVTVTFDAAKVDQPGDYQAELALDPNDTPYHIADIPVTLHAAASNGLSHITGTLSLAPTICGDPVTAADHASVQINPSGVRGDGPAVWTDENGHYSFWLDGKGGPVTLIFQKNGYQLEEHVTNLNANATTTVNTTLKPQKGCA